MPTSSRLTAPFKTLHISLQTPEPDIKTIEKSPEPKEPIPQNVNKQIDVTKPIQTKQTAPKPEIITAQPKITEPPKPKVSISATDLMQQAQNHTDIHITHEFTARSENNEKQDTPWNTLPKASNPNADIPYLATYDLAVDMDFYSQGYRGDIERFFDAVILKKTFTTKYGTKISCALAVVLVCGWK